MRMLVCVTLIKSALFVNVVAVATKVVMVALASVVLASDSSDSDNLGRACDEDCSGSDVSGSASSSSSSNCSDVNVALT